MLAKLLLHTATQYPDRTGLVYGEGRWTWAELLESVSRLARGLDGAGIRPDDHVALWLTNSPCFVISYFAILARGAVVVPLNPDMKPGDFAFREGHLKAVITSSRLESLCRQSIESTDDPEEIVFLACPDPDRCLDWKLFDAAPLAPTTRESTDLAMLQYSSGSTGRPKPFYRTHGQCMAEVGHFGATCGISVADVIFGALPLFHAHGMANTLWAAVGSGARLELMKNPQPFSLQWQRALRLLESEHATVFPGVPIMFQHLADAPEARDLSRLRLCFSAGNPLPRELFDRFLAKFGVPVRQLYGCTEAGSVTINLDPDPQDSAETVGLPMQGVELDIRSEQGESLPTGETGEVAFRSLATTTGYADDRDDSLDFQDGWFLTGDMGRIDTAGRLEIIGRKKFVISVAGHKVYANEVEAVLAAHPQITEAVVIAVSDDRTGQAIKAFAVLDSPLTEDRFFQYCRTQLPAFKRPREVVFAESLPKTPLGKVSKDQLA